MMAREIMKRRSHQLRQIVQWRWPLDEVFVKINGETHYRGACRFARLPDVRCREGWFRAKDQLVRAVNRNHSHPFPKELSVSSGLPQGTIARTFLT